ncbi:probable serine/threonine-protein kinase PIX13 [Salvia hispanica]|uniref:probable serine/threonine-protein kinase PIX13 n=1 Tax=Salvia hispanica TaxID=49212 RepID=UPI0020098BFA|nr:probable serine/threonine-protein kinase PIX13 [Salvia hispanica]
MWCNGEAVEHVLVRWSDGSESPSWEPRSEVQKRFPDIPLEGKEVSKEGGVVTNAPTPDSPAEVLDDSHVDTVVSTESTGEAAEQQKEELSKAAMETAPTRRQLRPRESLKQPERLRENRYLNKLVLFIWNSWTRVEEQTDSHQQQQLPPGFEFYPTDAELVVYAMKRAIRNFRSDLVLGEGGFGSVYKRFMNCESDQCFREWQSEVNFFGRVVKQLGHCHETQQLLFGRLSHLDLLKLFGYRWDDNDLLLVYEFKKKGSFENHPFKSYGHPLLGHSSMKMLIGASRGLQNLHSSDIKVIDRDFKSSNILLDKISDFGLATTGPFADKTPVSARIMGTFGCMAPEYIMTGHVNVKSDVYGFGVLLLEVILISLLI